MTHITVKTRLEFKPYFGYIFRENFFKPLSLLIIFFTLINLFLLINYFVRILYFNLTYPWFQIILVPTVFVFIPLFFYIQNKTHYNNSEVMREYKIFEFTENDVRISTDKATVLVEWQNFYKVSESKKYLILFYDFATAYFVAKKDFASPAQLEEVYRIIKSKPGLVQALLK